MFACVSLRTEDRVIKAFSLVSVLTVCSEPVVKTPDGSYSFYGPMDKAPVHGTGDSGFESL